MLFSEKQATLGSEEINKKLKKTVLFWVKLKTTVETDENFI